MPISHVTKMFGVEDCKIAKMLTDPSGGTATYGPLVDVPGIKSLEMGGSISSKSLRGDNSLLDTFSNLEEIELSMDWAKLSLDVQAIMMGGTVADTGLTPNQVATYSWGTADRMGYFKLEAKSPIGGADSVGGDIHIVAYKCIVSDFPETGFAEEDYMIQSVTVKAMPSLAYGKWGVTVLNETAVAIA